MATRDGPAFERVRRSGRPVLGALLFYLVIGPVTRWVLDIPGLFEHECEVANLAVHADGARGVIVSADISNTTRGRLEDVVIGFVLVERDGSPYGVVKSAVPFLDSKGTVHVEVPTGPLPGLKGVGRVFATARGRELRIARRRDGDGEFQGRS